MAYKGPTFEHRIPEPSYPRARGQSRDSCIATTAPDVQCSISAYGDRTQKSLKGRGCQKRNNWKTWESVDLDMDMDE